MFDLKLSNNHLNYASQCMQNLLYYNYETNVNVTIDDWFMIVWKLISVQVLYNLFVNGIIVIKIST